MTGVVPPLTRTPINFYRFGRSFRNSSRVSVYLGLVVQHCMQQRIVDFDFSVIADEAEFAELVHEEADAGTGGPDHLRKGCLADIRDDRLRTTFFSEVGQQQQ